MKNRYSILSLVIVTAFGVMAAYAGFAPLKINKGENEKKKTTIEKKIEITTENGEKSIKVTTKKDGKTIVDNFTGKDAEEFLKKQEDVLWSGNGNGNFHFKFNTDSIGGFNFNGLNHFSDSSFKIIEKELEKAMEGLKESGFHFNMRFNGMDFNFDSIMNHGNLFKHYHFDDMGKMLDSMMQTMDIKIDFDNDFDSKSSSSFHKKIIISHSVEVDDVPSKKGMKNSEVDDVSFYPNPTEGDFMLRYESKSEEPIRISVKDITGREVFAESVSAIGIVKRQIDLGKQPAGSYILNLQQGKKNTSKKLIIH